MRLGKLGHVFHRLHIFTYKMDIFWGLMYSMVILVNSCITYLKAAERVDLKSSHCRQRIAIIWYEGLLINTMVVIILQYYIKSTHCIHLTYKMSYQLCINKVGKMYLTYITEPRVHKIIIITYYYNNIIITISRIQFKILQHVSNKQLEGFG